MDAEAGDSTAPAPSSLSQTVGPSTGDGASAELRAPRRFSPGDRLAGRYRIVSSLGKGGMGEVYRADDLKLGQPVALKFLHRERERDPKRLRAFLDEIKLSRRITHPNVCRVYDLGEVEGLHFLSMECIEGETLAALLQREGRPPHQRSLQIARQLCEALAAAHDLGILHRDLKPSNLMIEAGGRVLITDFGLAARVDTVSGAEVRAGTPRYMAPEQAAGREVTVQSDLYSLGLVLTELFTGRPSLGHLSGETFRDADVTSPEDVLELERDALAALGPAAERMIRRCLESNPRDRPRTAREVARALAPDLGRGEGLRIATTVHARVVDGSGSPWGRRPLSLVDSESRLDRLLGLLVERYGGREVDCPSGVLVLFESPWSAVGFALSHARTVAEIGEQLDLEMAVQTGVHLGEVRLGGGPGERRGAGIEVSGPTLRTTVGLSELAGPGQILMSRSAFDLARRTDPGDDAAAPASQAGGEVGELHWLAHGEYRFRDLDEALEVFEVGFPGEAPLEAPEDSAAARRTAAQATVLGWRPAPSLRVPGRPRWELTRKLGEGGFGEVWLATEEESGERRVFKFCYDAERLKALQREVTLLRLLKEELGDRADIARVLGWNLEESPYYVETAFTEGGSLVEWAGARGGAETIPLAVRLELVAQVAVALSAAHAVGVLHKDVKPANVLIREDTEGRPRAVLTDFGVGAVTDRQRLEALGITVQGLTELNLGSTGGTELYRAPELLAGQAASIPADVYGLGVSLYQLVVGDFERPLAPGWERHVEDELMREDIARLVDGNPGRRPQSAFQVSEMLRSQEQRRRQREHARRAAADAERDRRRRRLLTAAAASTAVFLVVAATLVVQRREAASQRSLAEARARQNVRSYLQEGVQQLGSAELAPATLAADEDGKALALFAAAVRLAPEDPIARAHLLEWLTSAGPPKPSAPLVHDADEAFRATMERLPSEQPIIIQGTEYVRVLGRYLAPSWSPDGRRVLTSPDGHSLEVRDAETGETVGRRVEHAAWVVAASFAPDGRRVASAGADGQVLVWGVEVEEREGPVRELRHADRAFSVVFSPDGELVASASADGTARVWAAENGRSLWRLEHAGAVYAVEFSPDGRRVVTASADATARLWDLERRERIAVLGHADRVLAASFSPDGRVVATASLDGTARIWDAGDGRPLSPPLEHPDGVSALTFAPDGVQLVTFTVGRMFEPELSSSCLRTVWNVERGTRWQSISWSTHREEDTPATMAAGLLRPLPFSTVETQWVMPVGRGFQAQGFEARPKGPEHAARGIVRAATFSPDLRRVLAATERSEVEIWHSGTRIEPGLVLPHDEAVERAWFEADGGRVLTRTPSGVRTWDPETGEEMGRSPAADAAGGETPVPCDGCSPDGLLEGVVDGPVLRIRERASLRPVAEIEHGHLREVLSVSFSPDDRRVLTTAFDGTAQVWDVETGRPVGRRLRPGGGLNHGSFSPDGRRVVTASDKHSAQVWDAERGERIGPLLEHDWGTKVLSAFFSPDGRRVVTAGRSFGDYSSDGTRPLSAGLDDAVRVWDTPTATPEDSARLAAVAELVAGFRVNANGGLSEIPDRDARLAAARAEALASTSDRDADRVLRWYFSHPWTRAVSPFSRLTVPELVVRFPHQAKSWFPGHPVTRRCIWPRSVHLARFRTRDLDPVCVDQALEVLVDMDLLEVGEKRRLMALLDDSGAPGGS